MSGSGFPGAIVVMDVRDGSMKAMASAPDYDPRDVASAIGRSDGPLVNRCFSAYSVGSSFKVLVAAAALEQGISPATEFTCVGNIDVGGQNFNCNQLSGHGTLDLSEALAVSCNCYFIELALKTGAGPLRELALQFGFSKADVFAENYQTSSGNLPTKTQLQNPAELANLGFGQGYLTATPVQICKMLAVAAGDGLLVSPKLVAGVLENGVYTERESFSSNRVIGERTAQRLQSYLIKAVQSGSGTPAMPRLGGAGGKTASAQTGLPDEEGNEIVHAWFCGFYPAENPQYAIVVFLENGQSGHSSAAPLFAQVANSLRVHGIADIGEE